MVKSVVRNSDDVVVNIIEVEENSDWPCPAGHRLEDPDKFPFVGVPDEAP